MNDDISSNVFLQAFIVVGKKWKFIIKLPVPERVEESLVVIDSRKDPR